MSIQDIIQSAANNTITDPYFKNVSLLLSGDSSTNGGQNNTFLDSSSNTFTITRNGNVTQGSFSPFGDRWSNYFNGSSDYLQIANSTAFNLSGGAYTIECFIYPTGNYSDTNSIISKPYNSTAAWDIYLRITTGVLSFYNGTNYESSVTPVANTWSHVAAVYDGTSIKLYLNGTNVLSATAGNVDLNVPIHIGYFGSGGYAQYFGGNISNLRIIKGTALYTSTFTPPTSPLTAVSGTVLLTCQSNRFIDNSTYANAITVNGTPSVQKFSPFSPVSEYNASVDGGSAYFDGSGDYLETSSSSAAGLTGDWTVEAWVYPTSFASAGLLFDCRSGGTGFGIYYNLTGYSGGAGAMGYATNSMLVANSSVVIRLNAWNHIAVVRSSNTVTGYANGVSVFICTETRTNATTTTYKIGDLNVLPSVYFSNIRVIKGTAQYSSNFTPPTSPLTNVPNTQLLCNFTNGNIIDSSLNNDLETVGNAQISTSVKKWGTGSMYFDGNGDYLTSYSTNLFNLSSGDFTVECWINASDSTSHTNIIRGINSFCNLGVLTDNNRILVYLSSNGSSWDISNQWVIGNISTSQWYHVVIVRSSSTIMGFLNGIKATTDITSTASIAPITSLFIGAESLGYYFNGYIDDLRITKGIARYTANFTPPTAPLPKQ